MANPDPVYEKLGWKPFTTAGPRSPFPIMGRTVYINPFFIPLWTEIRAALEWSGYENPTDWIGSYKYRKVAGTSQLSRHSYMPGIAFDWDYGGDTDGDGDPTIDKNPHLHRKVVESDYGNTIQLLRKDVDAILSIKTVSGKTVLRWLGERNGDSMHFDVIVAPEDIVSGIVPFGAPSGEDDDMATLEEFVELVRPYDIKKLVLDKVIRESEGIYFLTPSFWVNPIDEFDALKTDPSMGDWENLYKASKVRSPIWAV